jgi:hypothetical protein
MRVALRDPGIDDAFASAWEPGIGAEIMGRGKFGPHHGPWPDQEWNGWWGDNPPFRTPVFILTPPSALRPDERRDRSAPQLSAATSVANLAFRRNIARGNR